LGYHPEVILSGRRINDGVGARVARECLRLLLHSGSRPERVTVLGLTFKENVPDIRNSKVVDIVRELTLFGIPVQVHDPMALPEEASREYGIRLCSEASLLPADAVVLAVAHSDYVAAGWPLVLRLLRNGKGIVMDVKAKLERDGKPDGVTLWRMGAGAGLGP